jgi:hypothetical protein
MKFKIILSILFLILISCKNETTSQKEKELLEKELELTKRELEIEKKDNRETKIEPNKILNSSKNIVPEFTFVNPEQIVEAIIYSAKSNNFDILDNLCDPQEKGDIESLCLCKLSTKYNSEYAENQDCTEMTRQNFLTLFKNAKNPKTIKNDGMYATVEYEVENLDVKMEMVKRKNRWYIFTLSSTEP